MLTVPLGGTIRTSLVVPSTHICQLQQTILFGTARSFIRPTAGNKAAFRDLLIRLGIASPLNNLLISGHTDSSGDRTSNQQLSQRRTQSVLAVLKGDTIRWETLYRIEEGWGDPELTDMVVETGEAAPGDRPAINRALSRYRSSPTEREGLFRRYFARLLNGSTVPPIQPDPPVLLGCGEDQLLRGSRSSPSRDTSLPPIEGDFEPNRRIEFFFLDSTSPTLTCPEYPKWTTACSLTPPPPSTITVTIAPVETIAKGSNTDIQVTLNPSPLPFGTTVTLTLSTTSGTGEARFTSTNSATITITASGPVTVRGMTESNTVDNIRIVATRTGGATVLAQEDFTVTEAITIFLQFEVWNLTSHTFEPLPAGVDVDIVDFEPVFSNDTLVTQQTDARGRVFFNLPSLNDPDETEPDIFFLVHTNRRTHAGHTLPDEWSTKGWKAADGTTSGYFEDYTGTPIGTPSHPIVFRIGLDFHARFVYLDLSKSPAIDSPAPKRIPVEAHSAGTPGGDIPKRSLFTDDNGEVHGVIFDIDPGDDFYFHIDFEMTDSAINLPRARVHMSQFGWSTFWDDGDRKYFPDNDHTSLGTHSSPEIFRCTVNERNVALYFLKILREWSIFLFRITGGAWTGVNNLTFFRTSISGVAYSWPVGEVNIPPSDHWDRSTIIHEMSHQIMWKEVNFSSLSIGYEFIFGDLAAYHVINLLNNTEHALIEGWAEFMEAVFTGSGTPPYGVSIVRNKSGTSFPLGPPPNNRGESVEGAFANGLWGIFEHQVVASGSAHVPESVNGDIMTTSAGTWLRNTAVRDRFLVMIWNPFKDMRPISNPTTTAMINNIRSRNPGEWHKLQPELQAFNMAMTVPTVAAISPLGGPPGGGTTVTLTGTEFTLNTTDVRIGGTAATNVNVTSSTSLTATTPPGTLGVADVIVHTPGGDSAPLSGGFTYARTPVVSSVTVIGDPVGTPARGPTTGGTPITIAGTDFHPNAAVLIGGLPAENVVISIPTEITATTPLRRLPLPPGGVEVVVRNPDSQSGSLNPGFEYFLLPRPVMFSVTPVTGPSSGGTIITITGANYQPGVEVFFDLPASGLNLVADINRTQTTTTVITAMTPALPIPMTSGIADIRVVNPDGQVDVALGGFVYTP